MLPSLPVFLSLGEKAGGPYPDTIRTPPVSLSLRLESALSLSLSFAMAMPEGCGPTPRACAPPAQFQVRRTSAMHRPTKAIMEAVRITDSHAFCYQRDCTASGNIPTTKAYLMLSSWCPPFQGLRGLSPLSVSLFALLGVWGGSSPPVPRVCATPSIIWYGWARSLQERAPLLCSGALRAGTPYPPLS